MLKRILVPLDGSELSVKILSQVRRVLHRKDAEVTLLRVVPEDVARARGGARAVEAARLELEGLAEELCKQGAQAKAKVVVAGDPASAILDSALEIGPALIAMATHGRSGVSRFVRGSVAERVLGNTTFPLLLVNPFERGHSESWPVRKILVPIDGSRLSSEVLPVAAELAQLYGAELVLFHAIDREHPAYPGIALSMTLEDAEALLRGHLDEVEGVPVRLRVAKGVSAESILDAVRDEHADLVALTTHGTSGVSSWAFGSVAENVIRHCTVPLLVQRSVARPSRRAPVPLASAGPSRAAYVPGEGAGSC